MQTAWANLSSNNISSYFSPQPPQPPPSVFDEFNDITKLSLRKRLLLCIILGVLGMASCALSTMFMLNPRVFAKFYTLGSIMIISSSTILIGWRRQYANITSSSNRLIATAMSLVLRSTLLTVGCIIFQLGAAIWYALTYIPLGNTLFYKSVRMMLPI